MPTNSIITKKVSYLIGYYKEGTFWAGAEADFPEEANIRLQIFKEQKPKKDWTIYKKMIIFEEFKENNE
jgi:hypothetical protein